MGCLFVEFVKLENIVSEFFEGMAEIFEVDVSKISSEFELQSGEAAWDSLAIVSTIALVDDCFNLILEGKSLGACQTIADIEKLIAQANKA